MGPLEPRSEVVRAAGAALSLAALALFVLSQELGLRLRREEHRAWWAGSGRDALNAAGLAAVAAALVLFGYSLGAALVLAGTGTLLLFGVSLALSRLRARDRCLLALATSALVSLPLLTAPARVLAGLGALVERLFGGR